MSLNEDNPFENTDDTKEDGNPLFKSFLKQLIQWIAPVSQIDPDGPNCSIDRALVLEELESCCFALLEKLGDKEFDRDEIDSFRSGSIILKRDTKWSTFLSRINKLSSSKDLFEIKKDVYQFFLLYSELFPAVSKIKVSFFLANPREKELPFHYDKVSTPRLGYTYGGPGTEFLDSSNNMLCSVQNDQGFLFQGNMLQHRSPVSSSPRLVLMIDQV